MVNAHVLTIGTEITTGEIVNSNAAWISQELEKLSLRVLGHVTVRDQREEILEALEFISKLNTSPNVVIVTGGLGPTSDDLTRECLASFWQDELDFSEDVHDQLKELYLARGLPLREAHKHQCYFPRGSIFLHNPVGSALGFSKQKNGIHYFVLPGPPRELSAMWEKEVSPILKTLVPVSAKQWIKWTCLGVPESEIAELVEPIIKGSGLEVGYRAQVPYVKIKIFANPLTDKRIIEELDKVFQPYLVARGDQDLAEELLKLWPFPELRLHDQLTNYYLPQRLWIALAERAKKVELMQAKDNRIENRKLTFKLSEGTENSQALVVTRDSHSSDKESFTVSCRELNLKESKALPFKISLASDRGQRWACEYALWFAVKALRTKFS